MPNPAFSQDPEGGHEQWEYWLEDGGNFLQIGLPVTAGLISIIKKDGQGTGQFALGYASTMAATYALKYTIKKPRPENRGSRDAFPSGHTSSAFASATFLQRRYGSRYGVPALILAGIVGVSRLEAPDGFHDAWDVIGGAVLGTASAYIFTKPYSENNIQLNTSFAGSRMNIYLCITF